MKWRMLRSVFRVSMLVLALQACAAQASDKSIMPREIFPLKETALAAEYRGKLVFGRYCYLCHGVNADGNGRKAKMYNPRPANLLLSDKNDAYKALIIRRGGAAMGRSEFMPPWGEELTDEQIADVVIYLGSIRQPPSP